jgi:hypothetical protein
VAFEIKREFAFDGGSKKLARRLATHRRSCFGSPIRRNPSAFEIKFKQPCLLTQAFDDGRELFSIQTALARAVAYSALVDEEDRCPGRQPPAPPDP